MQMTAELLMVLVDVAPDIDLEYPIKCVCGQVKRLGQLEINLVERGTPQILGCPACHSRLFDLRPHLQSQIHSRGEAV